MIKWPWFKFYDIPPTPGPTDRIIVSWDTAMSSNELADYSVCVVLLVRRGVVYVLDVFRAQLGYPQLKRKVIEIHRRWRNSPANYALIIENKGSGMSLIQELKPESIYAIPILPEGDKVMRMHAQTAPIEAGAVHLPKSAPWLEGFRRELLAFPASRHNDQVDAFSQALKRAFAPRSQQLHLQRMAPLWITAFRAVTGDPDSIDARHFAPIWRLVSRYGCRQHLRAAGVCAPTEHAWAAHFVQEAPVHAHAEPRPASRLKTSWRNCPDVRSTICGSDGA